jgi:hypothetical protein
VSGGDVQLCTLERAEGTERATVTFRDDGQRHYLEIAEERRTLDGWALKRRIPFSLGEVNLLHDAIGRACALAATVRR